MGSDEGFEVLTWVGFVSNATERPVFYLDDIELNLWVREFVVSPRSSQTIMDEIGRKAEMCGLTPEVLESILNAR